MEETIGNEKLYPNLLMYVNFEEEFSGLDEEKTKKIKQNLELMDFDEEELINTGKKMEENKDKNEIITTADKKDNNLDNNN
jgi:hypothetical protein